ncbi:MAG TPA: hypothetical protein VGR06_17620 [Actinophytocola sp.]|jgi:hypothetical protein|uniref:hypothetical protein n=1 Tax=Actinophytocola sp. TaxID=1872138 RepID=UPI002DFAEA95|nr:hypothetical protein [Actinophytocola sp.]
MDGRGYLEKLIADRLGAGRGQPSPSRQNSFNLFEIRGVAIGLVAAEALRQEDAEQILADMEATLRDASWPQLVRHQMSASTTSRTGAVASRAGNVRPGWRQTIENPPTPALHDVIPLVGRIITIGEMTADLVSLELWSTFLAVNLAHVDVDSRRRREHFGSSVRWHGWDDVGTRYRGGPAGGSGSHAVFFEKRVFEPGPPADARILTLIIEHPGGQVTVPIPLAGGRSDSA